MSAKTCGHESCPISSMKALRNGFYYGGRVRFMHSLVMTILFKKGTLREKITNIIELTFEHGKTLGFFAFCFKSLLCLLRRVKEIPDNLHQGPPILTNANICDNPTCVVCSNGNPRVIESEEVYE